MASVEFHLEVSRTFMRQAEEELRAGHLMQASEKAWGAAAHGVKAVAEQRKWTHESHADLFRVIDRIVRLTGDPEVSALFNYANGLHKNFYEGWLRAEYIAHDIENVKRLLTKLRAFMDAGDNGARD